MENYLIVLFDNKVKKKIIKKYITYNKAKNYFDSCLKKNEEVIFNKEVKNGFETKYELGLVEMSNKQLLPVYLTDEMGRNIKVRLENENMTLVQISDYKIEEEIYDHQSKKKIDSHTLIKKYIKKENIKLVSNLNNKLIIQNEEQISIFSTKNENESLRLLDSLSLYFFKNKRGDCIFVKTISSAQKKYLIDLLSSKGFDKKMLYRKYTTFPRQSSK
jgi:hypothetical protein